MIPPEYQTKSKEILDTPSERYCEIYKIVNLSNGKIYVGQAVSHILNHKRYRPYGHMGRFKCHISEAFSSKKNQSHYLNNAIRKYGIGNFTSELIKCCDVENADYMEKPLSHKSHKLLHTDHNAWNMPISPRREINDEEE